jgi:hypothetical protein
MVFKEEVGVVGPFAYARPGYNGIVVPFATIVRPFSFPK